MSGRMLVLAMVLSACGGRKAAPAPDLRGVWVFDQARVEELFVVVAAPKGPERARAIERAQADYSELRVSFDASEATLELGGMQRTVAYRVLGWYGPLVEIATAEPPGSRSSLRLDDDRLTWYDVDGDVEFVLRRLPN